MNLADAAALHAEMTPPDVEALGRQLVDIADGLQAQLHGLARGTLKG